MNITLADKAKEIAIKAHRGQKRNIQGSLDEGKDYIVHVSRVARHFRGNDLLESVAWLHDVCEDTNMTFQDLRDGGMPENVIQAVDSLTRRKGENYFYYLLRIKTNNLAQKVKIIDLKDNAQKLPDCRLKEKYQMGIWIMER